MEDRDCKYILDEILKMTDDGFLIVDKNGIIIEMNEQYCRFIKKAKEEIIGKPVEKILKTTNLKKLIEIKGREQGQIIKIGEDTGFSQDMLTIVNRGAACDENGNVIGAVAQVKFRIQTVESAEKLTEKYNELEFYKNEYFRIQNERKYFEQAIGNSDEFEAVKRQGLKAAKTSFPIFLTGETGTGKETFASAIHNASARNDKPMVSVNCATMSPEMLEAELFGYIDGRKGKMELADGGTLFIDEIGDMPLNVQAKLLNVLQNGEMERADRSKTVKIDVRTITAARENIEEMIKNGEFREDLYYRLNVINIEMPPLRNRKSDIPLLAKHFLDNLNNEYKTRIVLSKEVLDCLRNYSWPGNIRELDNVIKSAYAVCDSFRIKIVDLPHKIKMSENDKNALAGNRKNLKEYVNEYEKSIIMEELCKNGWNCRETANELGIHKSLLYKKIEKYNIDLGKERYESNK